MDVIIKLANLECVNYDPKLYKYSYETQWVGVKAYMMIHEINNDYKTFIQYITNKSVNLYKLELKKS